MTIKPDVIVVLCVPVDEGNNSHDTGRMVTAAFIAKIMSTIHHLEPPSGERKSRFQQLVSKPTLGVTHTG
jgi:hypothetical protein